MAKFNVGDRVTDNRIHTIRGVNVNFRGDVVYTLDDSSIKSGCSLIDAKETITIAVAEIEGRDTVIGSYLGGSLLSRSQAIKLKKELDDLNLKYKIRIAKLVFVDEEG